ncbi:MAG TPA: diguanylate cyclase, partial [Acidimicrobiales bacterium]|nr:diguanylate cyclase [Acidimicrobiales bacterium]
MVAHRSFTRVSIVAGMAVALFTIVILAKVGGEATTKAVDDLGTLGAASLATVAATVAAVRRDRSSRLGWSLMAAGMASWAIAELIWACYELGSRGSVPFPSYDDIFYLLAVPLVVASVMAFPTSRGLVARTRSALDGAVLACSLLAISWSTALSAVYRSGSGSVLSQAVGIAYPAGDVVILTAVLAVLVRRRRPSRSPLALVGAGMVCMAVADSGYEWMTATNTYKTGNPIDALWVAAYLLIGLAALRPVPVQDTDEVEARAGASLLQLVVPYLLAAGAFTVLVVKEFTTGTTGPFLFGAGAVLVALVVSRQLLTLLDNRRLTEDLQANLVELSRREYQLEHMAFHDTLTNLANRKLFQDRLEHALAKRARRPGALGILFLDLDDFKTVNDSLGHEAGDRLLVAVAERLRAVARDGDTTARLGGDEFAVLIDDETCDLLKMGALAGRLLDSLRARFFLAGRDVSMGGSVGVVLSETGLESGEELMRKADVAMYAAKARGKGCYEMFVPDMGRVAADRLDLRGALDVAMERGEFEVYYQPIVELRTGRVEGIEALARWHHPERGDIPPAVFIPMAEETGRIVELGRWVLDQACQEGARWLARGDGSPMKVSVNLS